jgi:ribosomal protein L37AE/L43A
MGEGEMMEPKHKCPDCGYEGTRDDFDYLDEEGIFYCPECDLSFDEDDETRCRR